MDNNPTQPSGPVPDPQPVATVIAPSQTTTPVAIAPQPTPAVTATPTNVQPTTLPNDLQVSSGDIAKLERGKSRRHMWFIVVGVIVGLIVAAVVVLHVLVLLNRNTITDENGAVFKFSLSQTGEKVKDTSGEGRQGLQFTAPDGSKLFVGAETSSTKLGLCSAKLPQVFSLSIENQQVPFCKLTGKIPEYLASFNIGSTGVVLFAANTDQTNLPNLQETVQIFNTMTVKIK